jgi:CHAT domain-containing protein
MDRAEVASERGDGAAALALVARALGRFEEIVDRFPRDADRVAACDDVSAAALYLLASRIHLRLAQDRRNDAEAGAAQRALAFAIADRHRALALPRETPSSSAAASEPVRQWQQAATEHATAYQRLLAALTLGTGNVPALTEVLAGAERALADIEATLSPEQQAAVAAARQVHAFTAEEAQRLLPAGACLLEYQVVGRDYIMYAVTGAEVATQEGRLERGTFEGMTSRFVRGCAVGAPSHEAEQLAAVLLAPFSTILARHERVIVVPSGALNAVPFHVLPIVGKPLGDTHVVSYLPAASLLRRGAADGPLAAGATLVVGDPAFDQTTHPLLQRLPGAAVEAKAVAAVHGAETYVGAQATEATLRPLLRHRALLHLAAHGRLDEIAPNTSSIVLAGDDELTVSDLIGLDIGADLAVLSACDTGRGTTTMGGDLVGLVRGLLAAGVRRCVVSLWPVGDVAACVTMAAFHRRLKHGAAPAVALAQAQREMRTLSGAEIGERYRAMGGALAAGDRAFRRKGRSGIRLSAFPEVDTEEDIPVEAEDGQRTSIWAPFVLIGV